MGKYKDNNNHPSNRSNRKVEEDLSDVEEEDREYDGDEPDQDEDEDENGEEEEGSDSDLEETEEHIKQAIADIPFEQLIAIKKNGVSQFNPHLKGRLRPSATSNNKTKGEEMGDDSEDEVTRETQKKLKEIAKKNKQRKKNA